MPALAGLLVVLAGLWHWRRHNLFFRIMFWQSVLGTITEFSGAMVMLGYADLGRGNNNIPIYNIYLLCEVWMSTLAITWLLRRKKRARITIPALLLLTLTWCYSIWQHGWFHMAVWFYLAGALLITALLFYVIKANLETYFLSSQLASYLLVIFGQLLFYGAAFETLSLRELILELGGPIWAMASNVLWAAAQLRMYLFVPAFLLLRKTNKRLVKTYAP